MIGNVVWQFWGGLPERPELMFRTLFLGRSATDL
jgi:hypothetical protein